MKPRKVGNGAKCPKCGRTMVRLGHKPEWRPKPGQKFFFVYYDWCAKDRHVQLYEEAKVWVSQTEEQPKGQDELTLAFKATIN